MDTSFSEVLDVVNWSRAQFAMTAIYHWLFIPLTLGLGIICGIMESIYVKTGDEQWKKITKFWMRLFGVNFAIGVATGIILEFEFGTNWANYSYFVGDIFGAPLAIEGMMAFFLETTFLAVMFFGWDRVSKRFHLVSTWLVAVGANLSALWILIANAWMQYPTGMAFNIETARSEMISFWDVFASPVAMTKFPHTVLSGFVIGSVFVVGVSAWFLLQNRERVLALRSIKVASIFGIFATIGVAYTGDASGVVIAEVQPMKLASMEGLYNGQTGAGLSLFAIIDEKEECKKFNIEIPHMLSVLSKRKFDAYVPGIKDLVNGNEAHGLMPAAEKMKRGRDAIISLEQYQTARKNGDTLVMTTLAEKFNPATASGQSYLDQYFKYFGYGYLNSPQDIIPSVAFLFYSFRVMVGFGMLLILLFILILFFRRKDRIVNMRWFLWCMMFSIPIGYLATVAGWCCAEFGRQPWTIEGLLPTMASVTSNSTSDVKVTFFIFVVLFTGLLIAELAIMFKQIRLGSENIK
ncbi:MAG: cytochrome ubiquinol oxidase subunit I [Marinifilaceae bacterium]